MSYAEHRPALLRHCYRMLGAYADAEDVVQEVLLGAWKARAQHRGDAPVVHWLMRIATNRCLDELARRKPRSLPQLEIAAETAIDTVRMLESADWITPAPDRQLESRERVALAFVALLQRLPAKQRAVLLLKDIIGWSAEDISEALGLTLAATNSALHRARETLAAPVRPRAEPPAALLAAYIRSWEAHDLDALVALLRDDVTLAMPPHAMWFHGATVAEFLGSPRFAGFWNRGCRLVETRANDQLALAYYAGDGGRFVPHSIQLVAFADDRVAEDGAVHRRGVLPRLRSAAGALETVGRDAVERHVAVRERRPGQQLEEIVLRRSGLAGRDRHRGHPGDRPRAGLGVEIGVVHEDR